MPERALWFLREHIHYLNEFRLQRIGCACAEVRRRNTRVGTAAGGQMNGAARRSWKSAEAIKANDCSRKVHAAAGGGAATERRMRVPGPKCEKNRRAVPERGIAEGRTRARCIGPQKALASRVHGRTTDESRDRKKM
jgi:hypothetical protein